MKKENPEIKKPWELYRYSHRMVVNFTVYSDNDDGDKALTHEEVIAALKERVAELERDKEADCQCWVEETDDNRAEDEE